MIFSFSLFSFHCSIPMFYTDYLKHIECYFLSPNKLKKQNWSPSLRYYVKAFPSFKVIPFEKKQTTKNCSHCLTLFGLIITKYHTDWMAYKQQKFISQDIQFVIPRWECPHSWVRALIQNTDFLSTLVTGSKDLSRVLCIKTLIPFLRAPLSYLITFWRPQLITLSSWALGFQHMDLRETQMIRSQHSTLPLPPQICVLLACKMHMFCLNSPQNLNLF